MQILFHGLIERKFDGFKYVTSANFADYGLLWRRAKVPVLFGSIFKGSYFCYVFLYSLVEVPR
jgi:hypothetical protein